MGGDFECIAAFCRQRRGKFTKKGVSEGEDGCSGDTRFSSAALHFCFSFIKRILILCSLLYRVNAPPPRQTGALSVGQATGAGVAAKCLVLRARGHPLLLSGDTQHPRGPGPSVQTRVCTHTHTPWSPGKAGLLLPTPPPPHPAPLRAAAMHTCAPILSRCLHPLAAPLGHFSPDCSRETLRGWGQRVQSLSEPDRAGLGGFASAQTRGCAAGWEQRTERFQMEGRPRAALPK